MSTKNQHANKIKSVAPEAPVVPPPEPPALALEFVGILHATAVDTLLHWLKETKAPPEAYALVDELTALNDYYWVARHQGAVPFAMNHSIADDVCDVINNIAALGGEFHSANGSVAREV